MMQAWEYVVDRINNISLQLFNILDNRPIQCKKEMHDYDLLRMPSSFVYE